MPRMHTWMDERRDFTSFSTVCQPYPDAWRLIMKGCVQWHPFITEKISASGGLIPGTARSAGQRLTNWATGAAICAKNEINQLWYWGRLIRIFTYYFDFLDPKSHSLYIFVGKKFSINNLYLEFQVLIRLCMCCCRSKYAQRIYIITPIKPFSQWDLSPKRDLFSYLHSVRHQRVQYLFICEKSFVYCYCIFSSILVYVLQKHISHWDMSLLLFLSSCH